MAVHYDDLIAVLPESLAEKIAAGEVIERPGSVLKELIENSLDAGADRIVVDIEDAGFALLRVADNGRGMSPDNMQRSILRHATSKIRTLQDLETISTMGFRGEALASVAAVSRLTIASSASSDGVSAILAVEGGVASPLAFGARARGTTVTVKDLFFNTPARKKFVKSRRSERTYLVRLVEQLAVPFPGVHFVLQLEGEKVLDTPPVGSVRERIGQIAGTAFAAALVECSGEIHSGAHVSLLVCAPEHSSSRPRFQDLYVNLRRVDCDSLTFALRNAFAPFLAPGLRPAFFAFVDVDPGRVDVNVHPTKQRVKFDDERAVAGAVHRIVQQGLSQVLAPSPGSSPAAPSRSQPAAPEPAQTESQTTLAFGPVVREPQMPYRPTAPASEPDVAPQAQWDLITCYQLHNLFILAPLKNGIMLVDQHAAHERILYEQALDDLAAGAAASQQLLFPVIVELSPAEKSVVDASRETLRRLGYETSDFGGNAVAVSSIPAFVQAGRTEQSVREMVSYLLDESTVRTFPDPQMRFAAAFACGCAIKAGQELSREEMSGLLNGLFATRSPFTCPHGRPTVTRFSLEELRRRFLR
jgi:DNA mismatch repair protein MutL